MKRTIFLTGCCVLALTALIWLPASLKAQRGREHGNVHSAARVGSVHFGVPEHRGPIVRPGVRPEFHGYRNPYRGEYFRLFRPGYRSFLLDGAMYYYYDFLPPACPPVLVNGLTYYFCDGVYYQPYIYNGQTVYMVAPF